ncbi:MAG: hypothetical protein ACLTSK_02745 [Christensenellales bacterium]
MRAEADDRETLQQRFLSSTEDDLASVRYERMQAVMQFFGWKRTCP